MIEQATLVMFGVFLAITLIVTYWASGRSMSSRGYYAAHREISGAQNGWAIAGDYMSAASFLGITGLIAFYGIDGFMYAVGWLAAYLAVLFLIAEPLRNTGKFTIADVISYRLKNPAVRAIAAISTLVITLLYMVAQMVGAGSLINLMLQRIDQSFAIVLIGAIMLVYVLFGGMLATTWVQIIKAGLLVAASIALAVLVLRYFHFSPAQLLQAATHVRSGNETLNLLQPGLLFRGRTGALDLLSLGLALVLGTAGLPHILMRFFTVPNARAARVSVGWAIALIGFFYLMTTFLGLGAATIVGEHNIGKHVRDTQAIRYIATHPGQAPALNADLAADGFIVPTKNSNLATPLLAYALGGPLLTAFVAAVAFATILAVVAGLTIAASSAFAHDIWWTLILKQRGDEREYLFVARTTAFAVGVLSIVLSVQLRYVNVAYLVGLAFAVAASANVPALLLALTWRKFSGTGAICGMLTGLISSVLLIAVSPQFLGAHALFPLQNPGIVSIPLGFFGAIAGSLAAPDKTSEELFTQLEVRANTGIGAEV